MVPSHKVASFGLLAIAMCAGCTDPYAGRMAVSGSVKLKGQPIKEGTIAFVPLDDQPTGATAMITDGEFRILREHGLMAGRYLIRVSSGDRKTAINPVDESKPPGPGGGTNVISKELVPPTWNVKSKQERAITTDGPNQFDFVID